MTTPTPILQRVRQAMGHSDAVDEQRDPAACRAHGCPCRGTIDVGSTGRFVCSWHAWADGNTWPRLTEQLHAHRWLLDHVGELMRLDRAGEPWLVVADSFWRNEPDMQPQPRERRAFALYVARLRAELAYRIGVRSTRPEARQ